MMNAVPTLLRHATVTPGAGGTFVSPAPTIRRIVCENNPASRAFTITPTGNSWPQCSEFPPPPSPVSGTAPRNVSIEDLWTIATAFEIPVHRFFVDHDIDDWDWLYEDRRRTEARQAIVTALHELAGQLEDYSESETHNG